MLNLSPTKTGTTFSVKVLPRSSRSEIVGEAEGVLRVKLTAPPVEGAANKALVELLSDRLHIAKSKITIIAGLSSRNKTVHAEGVKPEDIEALLK